MIHLEVIVPRVIDDGSAESPFIQAGSMEPDTSGDE